jgi:hypothetical protein
MKAYQIDVTSAMVPTSLSGENFVEFKILENLYGVLDMPAKDTPDFKEHMSTQNMRDSIREVYNSGAQVWVLQEADWELLKQKIERALGKQDNTAEVFFHMADRVIHAAEVKMEVAQETG